MRTLVSTLGILVLVAVFSSAARADGPALLGVQPDCPEPPASQSRTASATDVVALGDAVVAAWREDQKYRSSSLQGRHAAADFERARLAFEIATRDRNAPITAAAAHTALFKYMKMRWVDDESIPWGVIIGFNSQREWKLAAGQRLFATADEARAAYRTAASDFEKASTWLPTVLSNKTRYYRWLRDEYAAELGRHGLTAAD
jgi:hypothetical protein